MPSEHEKRCWAWLGCSVQGLIKTRQLGVFNTYNAWCPLSIYKDGNPWSIFKDDQWMKQVNEWSNKKVMGQSNTFVFYLMSENVFNSGWPLMWNQYPRPWSVDFWLGGFNSIRANFSQSVGWKLKKKMLENQMCVCSHEYSKPISKAIVSLFLA